MELLKLNELKEKTEVYDLIPNILHPVSWPVFDSVACNEYVPRMDEDAFYWCRYDDDEADLSEIGPHRVTYYYGVVDFDLERPASFLTADQLPIEFYNHQIPACDVSKSENVAEFIKQWGMPYSPLRNDPSCLSDWGFLDEYSAEGIRETDALLSTDLAVKGYVISAKEAAATLGVLKECVKMLRESIVELQISVEQFNNSLELLDGDQEALNPAVEESDQLGEGAEPENGSHSDETADPSDHSQQSNFWMKVVEPLQKVCRILNAASCNPFNVGAPAGRFDINCDYSPDLAHTGQLTSAICNQIIDSLANVEVPWRKCACEGCDVIFKYKQTSARNPNNDTAYCCKAHADRQRKRNERHPHNKRW